MLGHNADGYNPECHIISIVMLNVIMLNIVMLSVMAKWACAIKHLIGIINFVL